MPIIAPAQKTFPKVPEGVHRAVCIGVFDIGTQSGGNFGPKRNVVIMWEISDERMEDGRPFAISETYTLTMNEKGNLRKKINAWRGKALTEPEAARFDVGSMLGKPCQLAIAHNEGKNGNVYANITSIMAMPKGMQMPEVVNELRQFSIDEAEVPQGLPNWIAEKIRNSEEWVKRSRSAGAPRASGDQFDEFNDAQKAAAESAASDSDIPF